MSRPRFRRFVDTSPLVGDLEPAVRRDVVRLRTVLVVLTFVGLLALVDCGLVDEGVALGTGALAALGAVAAHRFRSRTAMITRRALAGGVLSVLFIGAVVAAVSDGRQNDLAVLAGCMAVSFHPFVQDRLRELAAGVLVAALPIALAWTLGTDMPLTGYSVLSAGLLAYAFVVLADVRRASSARTQAGDFGELRRRVRRFRTVSVVLVVLVVSAAAAGSALSPPVPSDAFRSLGWSGATTSGLASGPRVDLAGDAVIDLRNRGELPDTPVFEVPVDSPQLWRGADAYVYDGNAWVDAMLQRDLNQGNLRIDPGERFRATRAFSGPVVGDVRTDQVVGLPRYRTAAVAPGRPLQVRTEQTMRVTRGGEFYVERTDGWANGSGVEYEVRSAPLPTAAAALLAEQDGAPLSAELAETGDPNDAELLDLPGTVPFRVHELAQEVTADASSPADAVVRVEDFLRGHATYDLDSPVPPRGRDIADHFLFEARSGACEQFATAGVVLLRSAGIPARLATGFTGGEDTGDGRRTLRVSDAHAWVEAWVPGAGWVTADPTAGSAQGASSDRSLLGRAWAGLTGWLSDHPVLATLLVVASILAGLLLAARVRRRTVLARRLPAAGTPAVAAFRRLQRRMGRRPTSAGAGETVGEIRARFGRDRALDEAFDVVQADLYAPRPVGRERSATAAEVLDELGRT